MINPENKVLCGADVINKNYITFEGKCGLITNHTGVLKNLTSTTDMLKERCNLVALFAPEHGVRGDRQAGENVSSYVDSRTQLPVFSLYGEDISEAEKMLASLDTVIFDIQDAGARFYTYLYTMTDAMKICSENKVKFVVLDRPNPIGGEKTEGTVLDRRFSSFVGRFPTPTRSGLTIGEFASMMNETENIGCELNVIKLEGWKRDMYYDDTDLIFIQPSPNLPTVDSAFCYIGTCLFENTNISEGRGTTKPFEMIGAPWLDSRRVIENLGQQQGVILRACSFTPSFSDYKDSFCHGIQLHITDRDAFLPFDTGIRLIDTIRKTHSDFVIERDIVNLLGTDEILSSDFNCEAFLAKTKTEASAWRKKSEKWYLYE